MKPEEEREELSNIRHGVKTSEVHACISASSKRACLSRARSSRACTASSKSAAGAVSMEAEKPAKHPHGI